MHGPGCLHSPTAAGVLRENGSIVKCFDEVCDNFVISDELRKVRRYILVPNYLIATVYSIIIIIILSSLTWRFC